MSDLGPLPKDHPRRIVVQRAAMDLERAYLDIATRHELTSAERVFVLARQLEVLGAMLISIERRPEAEEEPLP